MARFSSPLKAKTSFVIKKLSRSESRSLGYAHWPEQYFGVAQRRRRVFVVASARKGFDPAPVLFEWDGVRRDTAPSREARQTAPTIPARSTAGGGLGTDFDCDGGLIQAYGGNACASASGRMDFETETFLVAPAATAIRTANTSANGHGISDELAHTLDQAQGQCIAFPANLSATQCASTENLAPAMGAKNPTAVAVQASQSGVRLNETVGTLDANYGSRRHNGVMQGMQVRRLTPVECERLQGFPDGYTDIPWTEYQRIQKRAAKAGTSFEAELRKHGKVLRGPDMPACPDGPRYKALGNSWAVPNVRWIGQRIDAAVRRLR